MRPYRASGASRTWRLAAAALATAAVAACSPASYSGAVTNFADATATADGSLRELNTSVTASKRELLEARLKATPHATLEPRGCSTRADGCTLVIVSANPGLEGQTYPPAPVMDNLVAVMSQISAYAANLAALMNDDSATAAQSDIAATFGSIQDLANTVASISGAGATPVPQFATPVGSAVNWLVGQYANSVKLAGLKSATAAADPVIQNAAKTFGNVSELAFKDQAAQLHAVLESRIGAFDTGGVTPQKLADATQAAAAYDTLLRARPERVFAEMAAAHSALTKSLNSGEVSLQDAVTSIQDFATSAEELARVVNQLRGLASRG